MHVWGSGLAACGFLFLFLLRLFSLREGDAAGFSGASAFSPSTPQTSMQISLFPSYVSLASVLIWLLYFWFYVPMACSPTLKNFTFFDVFLTFWLH